MSGLKRETLAPDTWHLVPYSFFLSDLFWRGPYWGPASAPTPQLGLETNCELRTAVMPNGTCYFMCLFTSLVISNMLT